MLYLLVTLFIGTAWCRETNKFKALPTISNSLVNLGKMDVAFHFNSRYPESGPADVLFPPFISKSDQTDIEPCPCTGFKGSKSNSNAHSFPSDLLNKIFMSNELFPNKDVMTSISCCDSHEHILEDTVYLEYAPKQNPNPSPAELTPTTAQTNPLPMIPLIYDSFLPNRPSLPNVQTKPKAIEIFFFPKKKDVSPFDFTKLFSKKKDLINKKTDIQIVGDKEMRNDFKTFKYRPPAPMSILKKEATLDTVEKTTTESNSVDVTAAVTTTAAS